MHSEIAVRDIFVTKSIIRVQLLSIKIPTKFQSLGLILRQIFIEKHPIGGIFFRLVRAQFVRGPRGLRVNCWCRPYVDLA